MNIRKMTPRDLASAVVFGAAAWQSYWHTVEVANHHGESESAYIMALSIDGLMIVSATFLAHAKTRAGRILAASWFAVGVVMVFGVNLLAADPNVISRFLAMIPAIGMVGVSVMMHFAPQRAIPAPRRRTSRNVTPITKATKVRAAKAG